MKKRVRRCGGDDVGCEVSAFRSHCSTEILCAMHARNADFEEKVVSQVRSQGRQERIWYVLLART